LLRAKYSVKTKLTFQTLRFYARINIKNINRTTVLELLQRKFSVTIVLQIENRSKISIINKSELKAQ